MKINLKAAAAGIATLAIASGGLLVSAGAASAASSAPPFEPDANAASPYGNVVFYDAQGNQVTSGTGDLSNPFAYAVAVTPGDAGAIKANLAFAKPVSGTNPSLWTATAEAGPTNYSSVSSLPAGTPADIQAYAPTYPIVNTPGANISTFIAANPSDTNAGYANTIQVRLTDSAQASGTYWESDIAYNTTSAPITVDGTTVPANGWAQVFPLITPTTTTLSTSAPTTGPLTAGNPITLTATVPATDAGTVQFFDNGTLLSDATPSSGSATYSYTPATGSHSYTATFVPTLGDETSPYTTSSTIVGGSTSNAVAVTDQAPQVATSTALTANPTSVAYGASTTLTATVTENDTATTGLAGSVQFYDGTSTLGSPVSTTVGTASSTATLTTPVPAVGNNSITAVYTPSSSSYASSTSPAVVVTEAANPVCNNTGSSCTSTSNVQVTVSPGSITVSTPYTASNPFVLPVMALSSDGSYLSSSATFPNTADKQIVVTSTLSGDPSWTLSVAATPLTDTAGDTIPASGLGLTNGQLASTSTIPGGVTFTSIPGHNPSPLDTDTNKGLGSAPQTFATSPAGDGTAVMSGTLSLFAATSTPQGTYNGTLTFSVI